MFTIHYYSDNVQQAILKLPVGLLARYAKLAKRIEVYGPNLGMPHTRALGGGLFEIRAKSSEGIARVFYCCMVGRRVVMLHSFVKKTMATQKHEMDIAERRHDDVKKNWR